MRLVRRPALPGVILFIPRSGSTFLAHCLSNHPEIYCSRREPLGKYSPERALGMTNNAKIVKLELTRLNYTAVLTKLRLRDARLPEVAAMLKHIKAKIIYIERQDRVAHAISGLVAKKRNIQVTYAHLPSFKCTIMPDEVFHQCKKIENAYERAATFIPTLEPLLRLTYEEITCGGKDVVAIPEIYEIG